MASHDIGPVSVDTDGSQRMRTLLEGSADRRASPPSVSPSVNSSCTDLFSSGGAATTQDQAGGNEPDTAYPRGASRVFCCVQLHCECPANGHRGEASTRSLSDAHDPHAQAEPSTFQSSTAMSVIVTETADSPVVDGSQLPPTSVPSKTGEPRQSPLHGSEIHGTLARDVRLCAQFHHEGQQIFSRRAFCFELNGRDWRQIFGASRFTCLDPFSIFLLRLGFCIPMVGVSVWDIMTSFPYVYFTTWTNFLAAVHSCVALCSSVATLGSLSRDYDKRVTDQKESLEKVRGSCPGECAVTVRGAKVQNDSESPKSSKARCWVFNFLRLPSRTREVYRRLLSDPALCRDGVIFVPGHLSSSSRKCGKDVSPLPVNQTQLVHPSGMTGVDTSSRTPSPEVVVGLNFSDFPLVQEHETQEAHHQGAPGKVSTVKSTVWERVSAFIIFGTSMTGITASLITVTLFWCVLVPTGTPFKRPVHVACHSLCLISSFLICFTGRVPFLLYHAWFLLSVGLAYTAVNVAVYLVPIRVGKQVGYIYKIFNFPSHPLQAWLSFVFVATIGLCIAAVIPWLFLWKANTRFDPPSSRAEVSRPRGK